MLSSRLLQVDALEQNREILHDFYYNDDRRIESAVLALEEVSQMTVSVTVVCLVHGPKQGWWEQAVMIMSVKAMEKFFSKGKDFGFKAKVCLTWQMLRKKMNQPHWRCVQIAKQNQVSNGTIEKGC